MNYYSPVFRAIFLFLQEPEPFFLSTLKRMVEMTVATLSILKML